MRAMQRPHARAFSTFPVSRLCPSKDLGRAHEPQNSLPHTLQWWRRRVFVNGLAHSWQTVTSWSLCQNSSCLGPLERRILALHGPFNPFVAATSPSLLRRRCLPSDSHQRRARDVTTLPARRRAAVARACFLATWHAGAQLRTAGIEQNRGQQITEKH